MAKNLTAKEYAEKQVRNGTAAVPDWARGVKGVTESPPQQAAKASKKWLANITQAEDKFIRGCNRVSKEEWVATTIAKGESRIGPGLTAALPKIEAFATDFLPFQETIRKKAEAMPSTTLQQNIAKAVFVMTETAKYVRK